MSDILDRAYARVGRIARWETSSSPERHRALENEAMEAAADLSDCMAKIKQLRAQVERWRALADDVPALVPDGSPIHPDPVLRDYFDALKAWLEQRDALKLTSTVRVSE